MSVILSNTEVGPCRRELKIEVPAPAVEAEAQRVLGDLRQRVTVPGFRKGKVPPEVIKRRYREDIDREVVERLLPRYWRQAEAEAGFEPLIAPKVSNVDHAPAGPLTFVATVEVRPVIELRNLADFALPPLDTEPSRAEVDQALEDLRRSQGSWKLVERSAERGDLVEGELLELSGHEHHGEAAAPAEPRPAVFEVGNQRVWEELSLAATGTPAGREIEFVRRHEGEGEAHEHRYRLRVNAVKELELRALDDEFAKGLGLESLEALRADLEERLRRAKGSDSRRRREAALLDQLRERHPVPLPEWVVEEEIRGLMTDYAEELARQGVNVEHAPINWSEIAEQARPQAERRVHARLLLDAVSAAKDLKVSEAEFEATLAAIAGAQGRTAPALRRELDEAGKLASLRAQMRRERTLRFLLGESGDGGGKESDEAPVST